MIKKRYLLCTRIPIFRKVTGDLYCDPLWAKDLKYHLDYIEDFSLCCPVVETTESSDVLEMTNISEFQITKLFPLKKDVGLGSIVKNFLPNWVQIVHASRYADVIHSGGAGWAFPLSFYLLFIKPFIKFQWIVVIESSFWMLRKNEKVTCRKFFEHHLHTIMLRQCIKLADARVFTQTFYKDYFTADEDRILIAPATWVEPENILSLDVIAEKHLKPKKKALDILFPSRMEENKGVFVVLEAIRLLSIKLHTPVNITLMGSGSLSSECIQFSNVDHGFINVQYESPVEYGAKFFHKLADYDLVIVANLAEEQPRIIFDSFSQGVPVIASNTTGIEDITKDNVNALLYQRGSAADLTRKLLYVIENPSSLKSLATEALKSVESKTHIQMHKDRALFLEKILSNGQSK